MSDVVYRIVEHDGGWAYKLGAVFSETFPDRKTAEAVARRVADEQRLPGDDEAISWEDEFGVWHDEAARGEDRPNAYVAAPEVSDATDPGHTAAPRPKTTLGDVGAYALAAYDRGDAMSRHGTRVARAGIRSDPLVTMLIAVLCGMILGVLLPRRA